jgi:hypothetical protein
MVSDSRLSLAHAIIGHAVKGERDVRALKSMAPRGFGGIALEAACAMIVQRKDLDGVAAVAAAESIAFRTTFREPWDFDD